MRTLQEFKEDFIEALLMLTKYDFNYFERDFVKKHKIDKNTNVSDVLKLLQITKTPDWRQENLRIEIMSQIVGFKDYGFSIVKIEEDDHYPNIEVEVSFKNLPIKVIIQEYVSFDFNDVEKLYEQIIYYSDLAKQITEKFYKNS